MAVSTGQLMVTSQVSTHAMINTNANATNPFTTITSTNQGSGSHSTHHGWVWFQPEAQAGGSLGPAYMECQSISLAVHQELGVMPLRIQ